MALEKELEKVENDASAILHLATRALPTGCSVVDSTHIIIERDQFFNNFLSDVA